MNFLFSKIKILAITSRYPPFHFGGYEIRLKNILDGLARNGHDILVITSIKESHSESPDQAAAYGVSRKLHIRKKARHFIDELVMDLRDTDLLDRNIRQFKPDVIYLGHIQPLSKAIMPYLAALKIPIIYDEGGAGLINAWKNRGIWFYFVEEYVSRYAVLNQIKPLAVKLICKLSGNKIKPHWSWPSHMQIIFNSQLNLKHARANGVPVNGAQVIHSGIDIEKFSMKPKIKSGSPLSFIVPGRIETQKGQLDAVRLLAELSEQGINGNMTIVGENYSNSYYLDIQKEIRKVHLEQQITVIPMVNQDVLIDLFHKTDICLFPSYHKTGYSRTPLEAMACGCNVFSYGNEGSDEVIRNRQTGFLFSPADYLGMAAVVNELILNPEMVKQVSSAARRDVEENCSMNQYVEIIEETVMRVVRGSRPL